MSGNDSSGGGSEADPQGRGSVAGDSRCSGRPGRNADRLGWSLGSPFFPLVQSGLQQLGAELVNGVAELELGLAQHLAGRLAGEQACQAACLLEQGFLEEFEQALGFGFLFGREGKISHGAIPSEGEFPVDRSVFAYVRNFPPTFEMLTQMAALRAVFLEYRALLAYT